MFPGQQPERTPLEEAQRQLNKAKIGLMSTKDSTFITTILFNLKDKIDPTINPPTAATNGEDLFIHPDYWNKLDDKEKIGLLAHEAWHVALQHNLRLGDKDPKIWNEACDLIIDDMLTKAGFKVPDAMTHPDVTGKDMSAEDAYAVLVKKKQQNGSTGTKGQSQGPDVLPPGQGNNGQQKPQKDENGNQMSDKQAAKAAHQKLEQDVMDMLLQAQTAAKMAGDNSAGQIPGEVERALQELLDPKLDWRQILQAYMNSLKKEDYSFRKPNRRFFPDYHLPSLYGEGMGVAACAVDTSGSVTDDQFAAFRNEIEGIRELLKPEKTVIVDFDTSVKDVHELTEDDDIGTVKFSGYGGTSLFPVFSHFGQKGKQPEFLIVFSDLYCTPIPIEDKPKYEVIWICIDNPNAQVNFGKLIHVDSKDLTGR